MFKKLFTLVISAILFLSISSAQAALIVNGPWVFIGKSNAGCNYRQKVIYLKNTWYNYMTVPAKGGCPTAF